MVLTIILISIFTLQAIGLGSNNGNSNLFKIYNRYTSAQFLTVDAVSLAQKLPAKPTQKQQAEEFSKLFETKADLLETIGVNGNPNLNANFILYNNSQANRLQQTLFVMGRQLAHMYLEIIVTNQHDEATKINQNKQSGIYFVIYNVEDGEILEYQFVKTHRAFVHDVNSDLYGVLVMLPAVVEEQEKGNVRVNVDVRISIEEPSQLNFIQYFTQYQDILKRIHHESSLLFLDSLEDWDTINNALAEYYGQQNRWVVYAIVQLLVFIGFGVFQLLFLQKMLSDSNIVI